MKWFRFWNDTINDVKILQLSDYEYRMWTYLLSYASASDCTSGHFQITFKLLSLHFHQRFNLFSRAIETFQKVGLITVDEGGYITITNWTKRQFKSDDVTGRVRKHREVTEKRNVSVTAPDTDTDTDTDKPPIVPQGGPVDIPPQQPKKPRAKKQTITPKDYSEDFLFFWNSYPRKVGKEAAWKSWVKRNGDRPAIGNLINAIEAQKKSKDWVKENGQFIPYPSSWLNQGRWADEVGGPLIRKSPFKP